MKELQEKVKMIISAIRTINCGKQHYIEIGEDNDPCFWQREEWVEWILDEARELEDYLESLSVEPKADIEPKYEFWIEKGNTHKIESNNILCDWETGRVVAVFYNAYDLEDLKEVISRVEPKAESVEPAHVGMPEELTPEQIKSIYEAQEPKMLNEKGVELMYKAVRTALTKEQVKDTVSDGDKDE